MGDVEVGWRGGVASFVASLGEREFGFVWRSMRVDEFQRTACKILSVTSSKL